MVSTVSGLVPSWMCEVCGAISVATGAFAAGAYAAGGDWTSARRTAISTAMGVAAGGTGKFGRHSERWARKARRGRFANFVNRHARGGVDGAFERAGMRAGRGTVKGYRTYRHFQSYGMGQMAERYF